MRTSVTAAFILIIGLAGQVVGEEDSPIQWEQDVMEAKAAPGATSHTFQFTFKNQSNEPVSIVAALPHCECTTTYFDPKPVPPGKKGTIEATFHFEHRVGPQEKGLSVYLDKFTSEPKNLRFHMELPQYYKLTPKSLTWDPNQPQEVELAFPDIDPGQVKVETLPETFPLTATLQADESGHRFTIQLTPNPSAPANLETPLNIRVRTETELPRLRTIPITIKPATESAASR